MNKITYDVSIHLIELTADVVSAYVTKNSVPVTDLANLLTSVHAALSGLSAVETTATEKAEVEKPTSAQIRKSIAPYALISFEDGKPYKTLRRHLTLHGLSPESYREKWGLPVEYPMTSPSYSAQRSELARALGLGKNRKGLKKAAQAEATTFEQSVEDKPNRAGRPRKAAVV